MDAPDDFEVDEDGSDIDQPVPSTSTSVGVGLYSSRYHSLPGADKLISVSRNLDGSIPPPPFGADLSSPPVFDRPGHSPTPRSTRKSNRKVKRGDSEDSSLPPRPLNPELLNLHNALHSKLSSSLSNLSSTNATVLDKHRSIQRDLLAGEPAIRDELGRLEAVRDVCLTVSSRLRVVIGQMEGRIAHVRKLGDVGVDEMVCSSDVVYNQSVPLFSYIFKSWPKLVKYGAFGRRGYWNYSFGLFSGTSDAKANPLPPFDRF